MDSTLAGRCREWFAAARFEARYLVALARLNRSLLPTSRTAVCIHLYYVDSWPLFARRLAQLGDLPFDIFVTMPTGNALFAATIRAEFPRAHVVLVPNHGRGTLPFVKVAQLARKRHYEVVLKLHCKNPRHPDGGQSMLKAILDRLLPESPRLLAEVISRLSRPEAGVLGPSEVYCPLSLHFSPNRERVGELLAGLLGEDVAREVLDDPDRYGFFAGSAFWGRLDAIEPLLRFRAFDFEPESGQRDGTLPHALERMFSLLPQLRGRQVLEMVDGAIQVRAPEARSIPTWFGHRS
ncbi:MAG TPA: rhamnan synthesis F family protein [Vicinamibacteria bacterium]|nr:rhamnan synthesis F family protein [Vicinamibacteria bacterium]